MYKNILITIVQGLGCAVLAIIFLISVPIAFLGLISAIGNFTTSGNFYITPMLAYCGILLFWATAVFSLCLWDEKNNKEQRKLQD